MQHRLVIIGSLYENVALVKEAKKRGIYTIVCDGYKNGHSKDLADKFYDIDIRDTDQVAEMCAAEKADGIIGSFSDLVFEKVTEIADKAGLKWYVPADKLRYYRDKKAAKDLLRSIGANVPENRLIKADFSDEDVSDMEFPLVLKPVSGWGSKGIVVVRDIAEMHELISATGCETVLAEEYNKGGEYNITAFLTDGTVNVISCGDREKTVSDEHSVPRLSRIFYQKERHYDIIEAARDTLQRFADATGQQYGVLSMQCFYYNGKLTVCEIAGRILAYENDIIGFHSGLNIPELLLDCVYDMEHLKEKLAESRNYVPPEIYARLYFFAKDKKNIANMDNVFELCRFEKLTDDVIFYNEGETVNNSGNKSYFSTFSFTADDKEELDATTRYFYDKMKVYSEDGENIIYPSYPDPTKN